MTATARLEQAETKKKLSTRRRTHRSQEKAGPGKNLAGIIARKGGTERKRKKDRGITIAKGLGGNTGRGEMKSQTLLTVIAK